MAKKLTDSFYTRLNKLFLSGPALRRKIRGQDKTPYYDKDVANYGWASVHKQQNPFSNQNSNGEANRFGRYAEFTEMEKMGEIATALNLYADETCSGDEKGKSFHIFSDNPDIRKALEDLFYDVVNVEFNLRPWVRNLSKYGDLFIFNEVVPDHGVINVMPIPVNEIEREEGFDKNDPYAVRFKWMGKGQKTLENWQICHIRLLGNDAMLPYGSSVLDPARSAYRQLVLIEDAMLTYRIVRCLHGDSQVWTETGHKKIKDISVGEKVYSFDDKTNSLVLSSVTDWVNNGNQQIWEIKSKHKTIKSNFNHPILIKNKKTELVEYVEASKLMPELHQLILPHLEEKSKTDISIKYENILSVKTTDEYSDVYDIRVDNNLHNFIADGIVVHNSPERRVFYVDVSNVPPLEIANYMEQVKASMRSNSTMDRSNGRQDLRYNPVAIDEDYFIPVRGDRQATKIESLAGGQHVSATEDVEYIHKKLTSALMVPRAYLGWDDALSSKSSLSQIDVRFSRTISIIQKTVLAELNKLAILHLYARGFDGEDLLDFDLRLSSSSTVAMQQKLQLWKTRFEIADSAKSTELVDSEFIKKELLGMTSEDIKKSDVGLERDKLKSLALDDLKLPQEAESANIDPFDPSNYNSLPGSGNGKISQPTLSNDKEMTAILLPHSEEDEVFNTSHTKGSHAPIKASPYVQRRRRQNARTRTDGASATFTPDIERMLNPSKNHSLKDIYDTEFLNKPLSEDITEEFKFLKSKPALTAEIKLCIQSFDKKFGLDQDTGVKVISEEYSSLIEQDDELSLENFGIGLKDKI